MAEQVVLWVKERAEYVSLVTSVLLRVKDPSKFGWTDRGHQGNGQIGQVLLKDFVNRFRPISVEVCDCPNPLPQLFDILDRAGVSAAAAGYFAAVQYVSIGNCLALQTHDLLKLLALVPNLVALQFNEFIDTNELNQLLCVVESTYLKSLSICQPVPAELLTQVFSKLCVETVTSLKLAALHWTEVEKLNLHLSSVRLLALQTLEFEQNTVDPDKVLSKFGDLCPNLQCLYFDWAVVDQMMIWDDNAINWTNSLAAYLTQKLYWIAVLVYCPDQEMKENASKIVEKFSSVVKYCKMEHFVVGACDNPNFCLITACKSECDDRLERLIKLIVKGRESQPDTRHFAYCFEGEEYANLVTPDLVIEFGGSDKEAVLKQACQERQFTPADIQRSQLEEQLDHVL